MKNAANRPLIFFVLLILVVMEGGCRQLGILFDDDTLESTDLTAGMDLLSEDGTPQTDTAEPEPHPVFPDPEGSTDSWLAYLNYYRALAGLPPVVENTTLSSHAQLHARYIVHTDTLGHTEDPSSQWYTPEGADAAISSVVHAGLEYQDYIDAIDSWMQAPFHALTMLYPALHEVGYGDYYETIGSYEFGAALDVMHGRSWDIDESIYPIIWPADGSTFPLIGHWGESPEPIDVCPGYYLPTGIPLIVQIGSGSTTPQVTGSKLLEDGYAVDHCVIDETTYLYDNPTTLQDYAYQNLDGQDAIFIIPRDPLTPGATYDVSLEVNGGLIQWSFTIATDPRPVGP